MAHPHWKLVRDEIESAACVLHNTGSRLAGNTQASDIEWFARRLYQSSNFGMGSVETFHWSLTNEEFEKLGLLPDRPWTGKRWEALDPGESEPWRKLARLCLYALPHIAERIGHRFMEQAKALHIIERAICKERTGNPWISPGGSAANAGTRSAPLAPGNNAI